MISGKEGEKFTGRQARRVHRRQGTARCCSARPFTFNSSNIDQFNF
jgi:hypothetical protein